MFERNNKKGLRRGSAPSFFVFFFSRLPSFFPRPQPPRAWNQSLEQAIKLDVNGCVPRLVLKQRQKASRKCPFKLGT